MNKHHNAKNTSKPITIMAKCEFIHFIIVKNIEYNTTKVKNLFLDKIFSLYKKKNFSKLFFKTKYISNTQLKYIKTLKYNKKYLNILLYSILFLFEENKKSNGKMSVFFDHFLLIINKLYKEKIIEDSTLLLIIKFIVYLSVYDRKSIEFDSITKSRLFKDYEIFKYALDIIKKINEINITKEFINFLNADLIKYKPNLFIVTKRVDMLELINLNDKNDFILNFLAELYSFKYSKSFLDVFIKKIIEVYDIKNNDKNTIDILQYLNRDLALLNLMQKIEKKKYKEDQFIASHGFVINNNEKSCIILKEIIIKENFTMIFSFCYSPNESEKQNSDGSMNKGKTKNLNKIPIVDLVKEDQGFNEVSGFNFFIQNNYLYHRKYHSAEEMKLCEVKKNQTYICYYSIKEFDYFMINIKSTSDVNSGGLFVKEKIKFLLKNKLRLQIGRFNKIHNQSNTSNFCFEGYIGPILLFKYFNPDLRKYIFGLKGSYEKLLYFNEYNSKFADKYDKDTNCPFLNNPNDENNNFIFSKNALINGKMNIKENLIYYLTPLYDCSDLDKKDFIHTTLKEFKFSFGISPIIENGAVFFFKNLFTPFEFLKYEGINFLVLIFELIVANVDNIQKDNENDRITMLNIFSELIPYIQDLIYQLNVNYYEDEIRHLLFALEKCVNKICRKFKMCYEIGHQLNNWIRSLTAEDSQYLNSYIKIRNEIIKFLLDTELYDMNEYSCIEFFFSALNYCINKRPEGLINMETLQNILAFTDIFKLVTKQKNIRKTRQFKSFKSEMIKLLITVLRKSELITPYIHLYKIISNNRIYNFRKYQLSKFFI